MQIKDTMTRNPAFCTQDSDLREVARLMVEHDCGAIPVVESKQDGKPVGVVTDRDIACRAVAEGRNPLETTAGDVMTSPCVTVTPDTDLEECCRRMEEHQVRRAVVVDDAGRCCGMVAQADIALRGGENQTAEVVREVSQPA